MENVLEILLDGEFSKNFKQMDDNLAKIEQHTAETSKKMTELVQTLDKLGGTLNGSVNTGLVNLAANFDKLNAAISKMGASSKSSIEGTANSTNRMITQLSGYYSKLLQYENSLNRVQTMNDVKQVKGESVSPKMIEAVKTYIKLIDDMKAKIAALSKGGGVDAVNLGKLYDAKSAANFEMSMQRYIAAIAKAEEQVRKLRDEEQKRNSNSETNSSKELSQLSKLYSTKLNYENQIAAMQRKMAVNQEKGILPSSNSTEYQAVAKYRELLDEIDKKIAAITSRNKEAAKTASLVYDAKHLQQQAVNQDRLTAAVDRTANARARLIAQQSRRDARDIKAQLGLSIEPTTIEQYRIAIANLNKEIQKTTMDEAGAKTRSTLTKRMEEYKKKLQEVEGEQKKVASSAKGMEISLQKIASAFGVYFSVQSLMNFGRKIVEITGEFELQHRALQAIIGDTQEANRLFDKTVALAVKSPYRIKDLVTYTKQLAAYRIETDKLYETNKMLADISSGLGVDMGRLILAFGQVKAANYLRGQELRQFSEAGVNILGELSKYFSELEGRAISTGEVFDRVSKRMVSFEDVEVVLKRLTEEGGMFFNMQEIQAETLQGQIANLRDSFDIFLNTIGQKRRGAIINVIQAIRDALDNVHSVIPVIDTALVSLAVRFAAIKIAAMKTSVAASGFASVFGKNIQLAILQMRHMLVNMGNQVRLTEKTIAAERRLNAVRASGANAVAGWASILSIVAVGAVALYQKLTASAKAMRELRNELEGMNTEALNNVSDEMDNYSVLVRRIGETNAGSKDRAEIISKLNSVYGEYLGFQVTEATNMEKLAEAYGSVNERMKNKAELEAYQAGIEKIDSALEKNKAKANSAIEDILKNSVFLNNVVGVDDLGNETYERLKLSKKEIVEIETILTRIVAKMDPKQFDTMEEKVQIITNVLREYFGRDDLFASSDGSRRNFNAFFDYMEKRLVEIGELEDDISVKFGEIFNVKEVNDAIAEVDAWYEKEKKKFTSRKDLNYDQWMGLLSTSLSYQLDQLQKEAEKEKIDIKVKFGVILEDKGNSMKKAIDEWADETVTSLNEKAKELVGKYGNEFVYDSLMVDESLYEKGLQGIIDYYTRMYEAAKASYEQIKKIKDAGALIYNKDEMDRQEKIMQAYFEMLSYLGVDPNKKKGGNGGNPALERLNKQISAIKEANAQYKKYLELVDDTEAFRRVKNEFSGLFEELGMQGWVDSVNSFSDADVKDAFENKLKPSVVAAGKKGAEAAKKYATEWQYQIDKTRFDFLMDDAKNQIEEMFDSLDMGNELEKLGIGKDFAKSIFDVDSVEFDDIRQKLEELKSGLFGVEGFNGDALTKWYDEVTEKINDAEDKAQKERLKKYVEYMKLAMNERAKIMYEGLADAAEIEKTFDKEIAKANADNDEARLKALQDAKTAALQGSKEKTDTALQKQAFEDFKGGELYVQMFNDIDKASTTVLNLMKDKLTEIRNSMHDLTPTELKAINSEIEKINDQLTQRSPFKALKDSFNNAMKLMEGESFGGKLRDLLFTGKSESKIGEGIAADQNTIDSLEEELTALESIYQMKKKGNEIPSSYAEENKIIKEYSQYIGETAESLGKTITKKKEDLNATKNHQRGLIDDANSLKQFRENLDAYAKAWSSAAQKVDGAVSSFMDNLEAFGIESNDTTDALKDLLGSLINIAAQIPVFAATVAAANKEINSSLGVIGWVAMAIDAIIAIVSAVAKIRNAGADRIIDEMSDKVDKLEKNAEKLEKAFDAAFSIGRLTAYNRELQSTLQNEIEAYNEMIAAENSKKRPDSDQITEWENTISDLQEQIKEQQQNFIEELGGIGEAGFKDAAGEFVDAWYEAFKETGDGLAGLQDNFNEMLLNIVKKQAILRVTERFLEPLFRQIDEYLEDGSITTYEMDALRAAAESTFPELNEWLKTFFESFGNLGEAAENDLTGLQKGIQGVTEETAEIIAAYMNAIRFYSIDSNTQLRSIAAVITDNSGQLNPMLVELRNIAHRTDDIYSFLYQRRENGTDSIRVSIVS